MKTHCYICKTMNYKTTGLFSFYVLPTIEIHKDDVFEENYFEIAFCWPFFAITLSFDKC